MGVCRSGKARPLCLIHRALAWGAGMRLESGVAERTREPDPKVRRKWARELDYRLIRELWACAENRIAERFAYEWHDDSGHWYRSYGNENWEFNQAGYMVQRFASINNLPIQENARLFSWPLGRRRDDHPGLSALGLWNLSRYPRPFGLRGDFETGSGVAAYFFCA